MESLYELDEKKDVNFTPTFGLFLSDIRIWSDFRIMDVKITQNYLRFTSPRNIILC